MGDIVAFRKHPPEFPRAHFCIELDGHTHACSLCLIERSFDDWSPTASLFVLQILLAGKFEINGVRVPADELLKFSSSGLERLGGLVFDSLAERVSLCGWR